VDEEVWEKYVPGDVAVAEVVSVPKEAMEEEQTMAE
jgi:hypothetical protein